MVTMKEIYDAKERIGSYIFETPVIRLHNLDEILGCKVYVKAECMQKTNSFKIRGALNKMLKLQKEKLEKGIITVSSGNHGKGVAYAAKMLGVRATVILTDTAPEVKINGIKNLGSDVILCEIDERYSLAEKLTIEHGYTFVHPFDDEDIISGQGTCGLEIVNQLPDVDVIVVPIGGGGLISGISIAVKSERPDIKVIGVEPEVVPRYTKSLEAGEPMNLAKGSSLADALLSTKPGEINFPIIQKNVDKIVSVNEKYIAEGNKTLVNQGKMIAEPSSTIGMGAILQGKLKFDKNDRVCFLLSGSNVELSTINEFNGFNI